MNKLNMFTQLAIAILLLPSYVFAQSSEKTIIKYSDSGKPKSISFSKTDKSVVIPKTHKEFFTDLLKITKDDDFKENNSVKLDTGHQTFEQYYKGIKVADAGYTFHYGDDGIMQYAHGKYVEIVDLDIQPSVSQEEAKNIFAKYQNIDLNLVRGYKSELLIKRMNISDGKKLPLLVYKISLDAKSRNNTAIGYINAHTGSVEGTEENTCSINSVGTFVTRYHGTKYANTDYSSNTYRLYDDSRAEYIHTRNLGGGEFRDSTTVKAEITDTDNYWQYSDFSNRLDMGLDVHWSLQKIYDRLYNVHSKNSYDNNGKRIEAYVNASFDNDTNGAMWYDYDEVICFGIGDNHPRAYSSMDIVAHEFGHGITYNQIGWGQSSKHLKEGLSDIWGVIMDYRYGESDTDIWKIGENVYSSSYINCLRDIESPNSNYASCKMVMKYLSFDYNNNTDSYFRSGVFSHWFYVLVNGGIYYSDNTYYYFSGVGMDVAENLIVEAVYNSYLRNCDDYPEVRDAFIAAAKALNIDGLESTVDCAWRAVGVKENQYSISGLTHPCGMSLYSINGLPSTYTVEWAIQDSLSSVTSLVSYNPSNSHECTVDNTSHTYFNDVLEARIFINNHYFTTLTKRIRTGEDFIASMVNEFDNPLLIGNQIINRIWTVHDGDSINIMDSGTITLTSDDFMLATITAPATGITNWEHFGTEVTFHVNVGPWERTLAISGQKDCDHFKFYLIVPAAILPHLNCFPELEICSSTSSREISISIGSPSEQTGIEDYNDAIDIDKTKVQLSISNVVTGNILYEGEMANDGVTINTIGWKSGVYAVKAIVGDYVLIKKVTVK